MKNSACLLCAAHIEHATLTITSTLAPERPCPRSACPPSSQTVSGPRWQHDRRAVLEVLLILIACVRHEGATFAILQTAIATAVQSAGGQWGLDTQGGVAKDSAALGPQRTEPRLFLAIAFSPVVLRVALGLLRALFSIAALAALIPLAPCIQRDANIGGELLTLRRRTLLELWAQYLLVATVRLETGRMLQRGKWWHWACRLPGRRPGRRRL